ncbi:MAG: tautomerase family protein [Candidatus Riflebacteria bacterium]|nr:tautomerase family protein [Candidatus Riflebacteria bacterium]
MPVIQVHTLALMEEQKKDIAKKFTKILSDSTKVPEDRIYVLFSGYELAGIAAGGHLVSETPPGPDDFNIQYTDDLKKGKIKK